VRKFWLPIIVAIACGAVAGGIAYAFAGNDIGKLGDWNHGASHFVGYAATAGVFLGYLVTASLVRGPLLRRGGFTLAYQRIEPKADGYRALETLRIADLLSRLRTAGYEPRAEVCDELGTPRGGLEETEPLAGTNLAILDPRVRGWVRVHLPVPQEGQARALGLIEIHSGRGESAEELAMFTMRVLGGLLEGLTVTRENSLLSHDPVATVTAGLDDRPAHRR
jgi:hypothetical protein